jgi:probable rRNA maturation factor
MDAVAIDIRTTARVWRRALPDAAARAEAAARRAIASAGRAPKGPVEISIVLGDDAMIQDLNRRWRGCDQPTNVLSFASGEPLREGRPLLLGDVVLAYGTIAREAAAQGKALADHFVHLVAHGVLHLLGYDHETPAEARAMEALERRVLAGIGVGDPYRARETVDG